MGTQQDDTPGPKAGTGAEADATGPA